MFIIICFPLNIILKIAYLRIFPLFVFDGRRVRVLFVILQDSRVVFAARALGKHLFICWRAPPSFIRINIGMNLHGDDNDKYSTHFFYGKSAFRTAAASSRRKRENKEKGCLACH